jgi:hypothetical protein
MRVCTYERNLLMYEYACMYVCVQVMKGYLNNPVETAKMIRPDGWMHTGDIGRFDDAGLLYITDRCKELIKYKGMKENGGNDDDSDHDADNDADNDCGDDAWWR